MNVIFSEQSLLTGTNVSFSSIARFDSLKYTHSSTFKRYIREACEMNFFPRNQCYLESSQISTNYFHNLWKHGKKCFLFP